MDREALEQEYYDETDPIRKVVLRCQLIRSFTDEPDPGAPGDYCFACGIWMVPTFGCRHEVEGYDEVSILTFHSRCCIICKDITFTNRINVRRN